MEITHKYQCLPGQNILRSPFLNCDRHITCCVGDEICLKLEVNDPNSESVCINAFHIPLTAKFRDYGDGSAEFRWTPKHVMRFCLIFTAGDQQQNDLFHSARHLVLVDVKDRRIP